MALALKEQPGLRIGNLFGSNRGIALAMHQEEVLAKKRAALADRVEQATRDNDADARKLRELVRAAIQRPNDDWATGPSGK
jgi:hypothetical protein